MIYSPTYEKQLIWNDTVGKCPICKGKGYVIPTTTQVYTTCTCEIDRRLRVKYYDNLPFQFRNLDIENFIEKGIPPYQNIKNYIDNIDSKKQEGVWVYIGGGGGKTLLAVSILKAAIKKGYNVKFCTIREIVDAECSSDQEFKDAFKQSHFIVIDALDSVFKSTEYAKEVVSGIVISYLEDVIRRGNICIFTSKCHLNRMRDRLSEELCASIEEKVKNEEYIS